MNEKAKQVLPMLKKLGIVGTEAAPLMLGARLCAIIIRSSGSPNDVKSFLKSFIIVLSSGFVGLFGWYGMWMKRDSLGGEVSFNFLL